jgi:hypothetical protein
MAAIKIAVRIGGYSSYAVVASRHGDDNLAALVPAFHVPQALCGVSQRVRPVHDRRELAVFGEHGDGGQRPGETSNQSVTRAASARRDLK